MRRAGLMLPAWLGAAGGETPRNRVDFFDFASASRRPRGEGERETCRARAPADSPSAEPDGSDNVPNGEFTGYYLVLQDIRAPLLIGTSGTPTYSSNAQSYTATKPIHQQPTSPPCVQILSTIQIGHTWYSQLKFFNSIYTRTIFCVKLSINNHIVGLVHKNHIIRMRLMYHAACKVEFQPFKRSYSPLTFFNFS